MKTVQETGETPEDWSRQRGTEGNIEGEKIAGAVPKW